MKHLFTILLGIVTLYGAKVQAQGVYIENVLPIHSSRGISDCNISTDLFNNYYLGMGWSAGDSCRLRIGNKETLVYGYSGVLNEGYLLGFDPTGNVFEALPITTHENYIRHIISPGYTYTNTRCQMFEHQLHHCGNASFKAGYLAIDSGGHWFRLSDTGTDSVIHQHKLTKNLYLQRITPQYQLLQSIEMGLLDSGGSYIVQMFSAGKQWTLLAYTTTSAPDSNNNNYLHIESWLKAYDNQLNEIASLQTANYNYSYDSSSSRITGIISWESPDVCILRCYNKTKRFNIPASQLSDYHLNPAVTQTPSGEYVLLSRTPIPGNPVSGDFSFANVRENGDIMKQFSFRCNDVLGYSCSKDGKLRCLVYYRDSLLLPGQPTLYAQLNPQKYGWAIITLNNLFDKEGPAMSAKETRGCSPFRVEITDHTPEQLDSLRYYFDNGLQSTDRNPVTYFTTEGDHWILRARWPKGACIPAWDSIRVRVIPIYKNSPQPRLRGTRMEGTHVRIAWDRDSITQFFEIEKSTDQLQWQVVGSSTDSTYWDANNTTFPRNYYRIRGTDSCGNVSAYSGIISSLPLKAEPNLRMEVIIQGNDQVYYPSSSHQLLNSNGRSIPATDPTQLNTDYQAFELHPKECYQWITLGTRPEDYSSSNEVCLNSGLLVAVPNSFTPNGDGLNDRFNAGGPRLYHVQEMKIYNRWGALVFKGESGQGWDGTDGNGNPLPEGTYLYLLRIQLEDQELDVSQQGTVTLIR